MNDFLSMFPKMFRLEFNTNCIMQELLDIYGMIL